MVDAMLENGVHLNLRVGGWSPLEDAAVSDAKESLDILRMIMNHVAIVN